MSFKTYLAEAKLSPKDLSSTLVLLRHITTAVEDMDINVTEHKKLKAQKAAKAALINARQQIVIAEREWNKIN